MALVLAHIDPNPKRANSGAWHRYNLYALGRTEEDLLAMGLQKGDLAWDKKQGHIKFEEGERDTSPLPAAPAEVPAPAPRVKVSGKTLGATPAVSEAVPAATGLVSSASGPSAHTRTRAAVRIAAPPPTEGEPLAGWYRMPRLVEATAPEGGQDRVWTITVVTPKGERRSKTARGDRLGIALLTQVMLAGYDTDFWVEKLDGGSGV